MSLGTVSNKIWVPETTLAIPGKVALLSVSENNDIFYET